MKIVITKQPPDEMQTFYQTGKSPLVAPSDEPICSALQKCAERVAGHISKPLDIYAIVSEVESDEYNAELMLQHLLLWAAKTERNLKDTSTSNDNVGISKRP